MSRAALLSMACALFCAANDIIYKQTVSRDAGGKYAFYCMSSFVSLVFFFAFCLFGGGISLDAANVGFGMAAGVLSFFAYIFFLQSFGSGNTVLPVTVFRLNLVPGIILAVIFLHEELSPRRMLAVVLCIAGIVLIMAGKNLSNFSAKNIGAVFLALSLAACLIAGLLNLLNKAAAMHGCDPVQLLFWRYFVVAFLSIVPFRLNRPAHPEPERAKSGKTRAAISGVSGILSALLNLCALEALKTADLGMVVPITQMAFVPVSIFGWIALREKTDLVKIAGLVCAVLSVFLIA